MPRRKSKFQPDRKVRILREYTGADDEFSWEVVSTAYAMRRDLRGSARDEDDATDYLKTVLFVLPRTVRFPASEAAGAGAGAAGPDAFGAREFGEAPLGGRGVQAGERLFARGAQAEPGDAIQDTAVHGRPIFLVQDIRELPDRRNVEVVCQRSDRQGAIYGD